MDSEHKCVSIIAGIVAVFILTFSLGAYYISWKKDVDMAKLGFQRQTVTGSDSTYYQKNCDCR